MEEIKLVEKLLLTPIISSKKYKRIEEVDGFIHSPQKYYGEADEDMSDFTVGFYEILYRDILPDGKVLDDKRQFNNKEFAGDTINTFNTIANIVLNENKKNRSPKEMRPDYLIDYYNQYHCLANFRLIPMRHGRTGKKLGFYDCPQNYIRKVLTDLSLSNLPEIQYKRGSGGVYKNYFTYFNKKDFYKIHYLEENAEECNFDEIYRKKDIEKVRLIIDNAIDMMRKRAQAISNDEEVSILLMDYFRELNLL